MGVSGLEKPVKKLLRGFSCVDIWSVPVAEKVLLPVLQKAGHLIVITTIVIVYAE